MLVALYEGNNEILIFSVKDGEHVGLDDYFTDETSDRTIDDYDVLLVELPMIVTASLKTEPNIVHN